MWHINPYLILCVTYEFVLVWSNIAFVAEDIKPAGQIVEEMVQGAAEQLQSAPWRNDTGFQSSIIQKSGASIAAHILVGYVVSKRHAELLA